MISIAIDLATKLGLFFVATEEEFDPNQVSPGVAGFVVVAVLAIAVFFLGFDFVRRLRRSKYRSQVREEIALELDGNNLTTGDKSTDL